MKLTNFHKSFTSLSQVFHKSFTSLSQVFHKVPLAILLALGTYSLNVVAQPGDDPVPESPSGPIENIPISDDDFYSPTFGEWKDVNARIYNNHQLNKKLKRELAAQAALAGLFQPYSVGAVNVTAAVGGYQSHTAIAVGAGYRVNEKFATKAGIAAARGGQGVSYNLGVNYEFK